MWVFDSRNVEYKIKNPANGLTVKGEITNRSGHNFNSIVFRVVAYARNTPLGNATLTINGFPTYQTRTFEVHIKDITDTKIVNSITRCDIIPEGGY